MLLLGLLLLTNGLLVLIRGLSSAFALLLGVQRSKELDLGALGQDRGVALDTV